ncbi:septum formation initiator family protein [Candidatus Pelagibacter sp.]|nr:septum formation initiator family protein [Candidatus Pelagibacter sp.]|tara:strand:+ start:427 stop:723 length:297 start_codon:yes stop_codon:yes gene_type:complete
MINKIKKNYLIGIGTFLFLYFFFNLLDGERGLISLLKKENLLTQLKLEEQRLVNNIKDLEFKNSMLNENLDLDYIEILIREKFVFSMKNERLYILNEK